MSNLIWLRLTSLRLCGISSSETNFRSFQRKVSEDNVSIQTNHNFQSLANLSALHAHVIKDGRNPFGIQTKLQQKTLQIFL